MEKTAPETPTAEAFIDFAPDEVEEMLRRMVVADNWYRSDPVQKCILVAVVRAERGESIVMRRIREIILILGVSVVLAGIVILASRSWLAGMITGIAVGLLMGYILGRSSR